MDEPLDLLDGYLGDVENALRDGRAYAALALALALPDICTNLEGKPKGYGDWCDANGVTGKPGSDGDEILTGMELYRLRNAFLHRGQQQLAGGHPLQEFALTWNGASVRGSGVAKRNHDEGVIRCSVQSVCYNIVHGVTYWKKTAAQNPMICERASQLLRVDL